MIRNIRYGQTLILRPGKIGKPRKIYLVDQALDQSFLVKYSTEWPPTHTSFIHRSKLFKFYNTPDIGIQLELFETNSIPAELISRGIIKKR